MVIECFEIWMCQRKLRASLGAQSVKNLPAVQEDLGSVPESGRSPGGGNGYLLWYSCLENPMDRGAWPATVQEVTIVRHDLVTKPPPSRKLNGKVNQTLRFLNQNKKVIIHLDASVKSNKQKHQEKQKSSLKREEGLCSMESFRKICLLSIPWSCSTIRLELHYGHPSWCISIFSILASDGFFLLSSAFRNSMRWVNLLSRVRLFATPWTVAYQAPPSMGFSRQECWSGLPLPSPGDLPDPGIEPGSPTLQADALPSEPPGKLKSMFAKYSVCLKY